MVVLHICNDKKIIQSIPAGCNLIKLLVVQICGISIYSNICHNNAFAGICLNKDFIIEQLKEEKVITPISQDQFILSYKPVFKPEIEDYEKKIYLRLEKQFQGLKQCIWSTKAVNEFMLHLPGKSITILQQLTSRAPLQKFSKVYTITLEKLIYLKISSMIKVESLSAER